MPNRKGKTGNKGGHQVWKESSKSRDSSSLQVIRGFSEFNMDQGKNNKLTGLSIASTVRFGSVPSKEPSPVRWRKPYGCLNIMEPLVDQLMSGWSRFNQKNSAGSSKVELTYNVTNADIFLLGVFVLGRTFHEAWGTEAFKKQASLTTFLRRWLHDVVFLVTILMLMENLCFCAVVVTAVTEFGNGKPKFYSTPEIIAFCRKWRLTTNHVWLFSTRKSVSSFFAAYDALCEEGTTTPVCKALDEVADISVTASKDHVQVQGEILEGLVARMVSHESFETHGERFFVDINLFKVSKDKAAEYNNVQSKNANGSSETSTSGADGLADEDANLMIKLKFLTYKIRAFLIRNGLSILFKDGPAAYRTYYLRQMKIWGTSSQKQKELSKMLDEWASYIRRKCGNKQLSSSIYLTEAEPFLEQYARRSPHNQMLIGSAGNLVRSDDFLAIVESGRDEEGDLETERNATTSSPTRTVMDSVRKDEGLIVFFPGIPGCAKSALCKEILNASGGLGDDRPVHSLMGDLIKGKYWQMVANERRKKPYTITLADKNAPNEEVWRQVKLWFPGLLDKTSPCVGYVLLMFYHLYDGKNRSEFESELIEHFGTLVKIPLLKPDRSPLPDPVKSILEEGICLFELHRNKHGRLESSKGSYKKDWANYEIRLRQVLLANADSLNAIQLLQKGESKPPITGKPRLRTTIIFAAVTLPVAEVRTFLNGLCEKDPRIKGFLKDKDLVSCVTKAHVTLAHRGSHGVAAVTNYSMYLNRDVPVDLTSLLFLEKSAALEACLGTVDGEKISSKNEWPHVTIWTAPGVSPKEANTLPQLVSEGKAIRISINPPFNISGTLDFY
ncbi:hypothetical protein MKW92_026618 [Papaver armeniacum]|nr:hypothetical protein MKW92_026618 [Papaver armeniacum]